MDNSSVYVKDNFVERNKLKCSYCSRLLSVLPIFLSKDGKENICGRCKPPEHKEWARNLLFEKIISELTFSCGISNHCKQILLSKDILEHEKSCLFQNITCSICQQKYRMYHIESHFTNKHPQNIKHCRQESDNSFSSRAIKCNTYYNRTILLIFEANLFFIRIQTDKVKVNILIHSVNNSPIDHFFYEVNITDSDRNVNISYKTHDGQMFNGKLRVLEKSLDWNTLSDLIMLDTSETEKPNITITVSIFDKSKDVQSLQKHFKEFLECEICNNPMSGQIFQCKTGHSLCENCKQQISTCPMCREDFNGSRNFALEKIAQKIKDETIIRE